MFAGLRVAPAWLAAGVAAQPHVKRLAGWRKGCAKMPQFLTGLPAVEEITRRWKDFNRALTDAINSSPNGKYYRQSLIALAHNAWRLESLWNPAQLPITHRDRRIFGVGQLATAAYVLGQAQERFDAVLKAFGWSDIPVWNGEIAIEAISRPKFLTTLAKLRDGRKSGLVKPPSAIVMLANEPRDKWLYQQAMDGVDYKSIMAALKKRTEQWESIDSVNGIIAAIKRYCKRHPELPPVPARQRGRKAK